MLKNIAAMVAAVWMVLPSVANATADGPDNWAVTGVDADDVLNMRAAPNAKAPLLDTIPHDADGLPNLGCIGWMSYDEWEKATAAQRERARKRVWCLTGYDRSFGWVAGWYLRESEFTDDPAWTGGQFLDSAPFGEYAVTRLNGRKIASRFRPHIRFMPSAKATASTGCDRIAFAYVQKDGFRIPHPLHFSTKNKCLAEARSISEEFLKVLKEVREAVSAPYVIALLDERKQIIAVLRRADWD